MSNAMSAAAGSSRRTRRLRTVSSNVPPVRPRTELASCVTRCWPCAVGVRLASPKYTPTICQPPPSAVWQYTSTCNPGLGANRPWRVSGSCCWTTSHASLSYQPQRGVQAQRRRILAVAERDGVLHHDGVSWTRTDTRQRERARTE